VREEGTEFFLEVLEDLEDLEDLAGPAAGSATR